jgi:hypothetical protein
VLHRGNTDNHLNPKRAYIKVTSQETKNEIEFYEDIVIKKPISEVMITHLIQGFVEKVVSPGNYVLYVIGEDHSHSNPTVIKPLKEWLNDNGIKSNRFFYDAKLHLNLPYLT